MPLNKDVLGAALYEKAEEFNNKTPEEIGDIEEARLQFWKDVAGAIIDHIKTAGQIPGTGLTAGSVAVTGTAKMI